MDFCKPRDNEFTKEEDQESLQTTGKTSDVEVLSHRGNLGILIYLFEVLYSYATMYWFFTVILQLRNVR